MVLLASCNHDELGRLGWEGKSRPGDQTGSEVSLVPYNTWDPGVWEQMYRADDPTKAWNIGQAGIQMARNNNVGYDQSDRYSFVNQLLITGNIDKIEKPCNTDCTAGTCGCIIVAGYADFPRDLRSNVWDARIMQYGRFTRYTEDKYLRSDKYLKCGDILRKNGHVVIVVTDGDLAEQYSTIPRYVLKITSLTPVYTQPKIGGILLSHPALGKDNLVDYCDEFGDYYYVRIVDKFGWIPKSKAERRDKLPDPQINEAVRFIGERLYTSSGGGNSVSVPAFDGIITVNLNNATPYPYHVYSKAYSGWCKREDLMMI